MAQESLAGMIKKIAQATGGGIRLMNCRVVGVSPLKLRFEGDSKVTISGESVIKPAHVSGLIIGSRVAVVPVGDGDGYFIMGEV